MLGMIKYLRGYLRIRVWGFSPERFMNLCSNKGILLWDISREGEQYYMCIGLRNFYRLRPIVKKTGTRVAILQRYGLPFLIPFVWQRSVFVVGCVLAVAFWIGSSFYVWDIVIEGNYQITTDVLESFLEEQQVHTGIRKKELNIEELEKELRRTFPEIIWVSIKLDGSRLCVDLKENDTPMVSAYQEAEVGMDLVAQCEGRILSMIVRKGVPQVAIGDTIEKGTVLVEGRLPIYNEDATVRAYRHVQADADIVVERSRTFSASLSETVVRKRYTNRSKTAYYLRVGEKEWGLPMERPFLIYDTVIRESRPLILEKLSIPIWFGTKNHREYQNWEEKYSEEEAESILKEKLITFLTTLQQKGVQIIEKNVKIDFNSGDWCLSGEFLVQEPVGTLVETIIEPIQERQETNE